MALFVCSVGSALELPVPGTVAAESRKPSNSSLHGGCTNIPPLVTLAPEGDVVAPAFSGSSSPGELHDVRVLLVDDDESSRRVGHRLLQQVGVQRGNVTFLSSGPAVVRWLAVLLMKITGLVSTSGRCFHTCDLNMFVVRRWDIGPAVLEFLQDPEKASLIDVAFLDISLPGMSGVEVVHRLGSAVPPVRCPIVATTGSVDEDSIAEFK